MKKLLGKKCIILQSLTLGSGDKNLNSLGLNAARRWLAAAVVARQSLAWALIIISCS